MKGFIELPGKATAEYMWSIGIDYTQVPVDKIGEYGYGTLVKHRKTKRPVYDDMENYVVDWWPWLNEEEGQTVLALMKEDRESNEQA